MLLKAYWPCEFEPEMKPPVPNLLKEYRKYLIDAAIVRILKSKKELLVRVLMRHSLFMLNYMLSFLFLARSVGV